MYEIPFRSKRGNSFGTALYNMPEELPPVGPTFRCILGQFDNKPSQFVKTLNGETAA